MRVKSSELTKYIDNSGEWMYRRDDGKISYIFTALTTSSLITHTNLKIIKAKKDDFIVLNVFGENEEYLEVLRVKDMREKYPEELL